MAKASTSKTIADELMGRWMACPGATSCLLDATDTPMANAVPFVRKQP
jgi:hypothetical protein